MNKHTILIEHVGQIREWLKHRGGIAIWNSADLGDPGKSWTAPVNDEHGNPKGKPTWQAQNSPSRVITDPSEVEVVTPKELRRFPVAVQRGSGLRVELTSAASKRVRKSVEDAGDGAWYEFDYMTQEAIIYVPGDVVALDKVN